jgi:isoquinoline 1-oxidoreductase beta subunit
MKRRSLILSGLGLAGALVVGWGVLPPRSRMGAAGTLPPQSGSVGLNGWIHIAPDGAVLLAMARSEMGQGIHTALAMLVAEELDVPMAQVRLIEAGTQSLYGNVAMFVGSLPLHPRDSEPGQETRMVRASQWVVSKLARELGVNATGGSSSVADLWDVLRTAAAAARAQLLGAAASSWKVPVAELAVAAGRIQHASGRSGHYGEFVQAAALIQPGAVKLKASQDWTLIGKAVPRIDVAAKSSGRAGFGIDVRQPEQLYAVIRHCPVRGGRLKSFQTAEAARLPGFVSALPVPSLGGSTEGVAVVGISHWHAKRAAQALLIEWDTPKGSDGVLADSAAILDVLQAKALAAHQEYGGLAFYTEGDVQQAERGLLAEQRAAVPLSPAVSGVVSGVESGAVPAVMPAGATAAARLHRAQYRAPYLAHAPMEPMNATAWVAEGRVRVWAPTQVPGMARAAAAHAAGVSESAVELQVTYLGGGFGRRLEVDVVAQAVHIARSLPGRPVQLVWPREEDLRHDFYRPAGVAVLSAALDARGQAQSLHITSAGDAISPRWMERGLPYLAGPFDPPDKTTAEGLIDLPYSFAHQRMAHVATHSGVPVGFWRAVGHSHNAFFSECFIDELAFEARTDPVAFRLQRLADMPRYAAVLKLAADKAGWGQPLPAGRARGVALHESFGSIVAEVAEVSLHEGQIRVHRVVCAADIGVVVNPGIVAQQFESAVIFGLSAALFGRIDIQAGAVQQSNFTDYRILSLSDSPPVIETHLVPSSRPPAGVGEHGTPPIAPAVANALFVLTGRRQRELPLKA